MSHWLIKQIDADNKRRRQEALKDDGGWVFIRCIVCRNRIYRVKLSKLRLPLRGHMFNNFYPGFPALPHDATSRDFMCPHAYPPDGDNHLFVKVKEGAFDQVDEILLDDFSIYKVDNLCPCGCGKEVTGDNKYADGLKCYHRALKNVKR